MYPTFLECAKSKINECTNNHPVFRDRDFFCVVFSRTFVENLYFFLTSTTYPIKESTVLIAESSSNFEFRRVVNKAEWVSRTRHKFTIKLSTKKEINRKKRGGIMAEKSGRYTMNEQKSRENLPSKILLMYIGL
jgi:hypothetical protein